MCVSRREGTQTCEARSAVQSIRIHALPASSLPVPHLLSSRRCGRLLRTSQQFERFSVALNDSMGILTVSDWWNVQSVVHPLAIGGATVAVLFTYFRCTSPRSLHPNSIFTIIVSVALGSTLSRIITQPELNFVRGLVSLFLLLFVEWYVYTSVIPFTSSRFCLLRLTTYLPTHVSLWFTKVFKYPPVLLAFRGQADRRMMRHHRYGLPSPSREHIFANPCRLIIA